MNIHIDKELNEKLDRETVFETQFGSSLYNLDIETSDVDMLKIYVEEKTSFMWEHHQLQYKENKVDYIYTNLELFIRNLMTGDSTINFEILHTKEFEESSLGWLCKYRKDFINYNVVKAYLGFAKRDLKNYRSKCSQKKLYHFMRGLIFANDLLDGEFDLELKEERNIENHKLLLSIRKYGFEGINLEYWEKTMDLYRLQLKDILAEGFINKMMSVDRMKELDTDYRNYMESIVTDSIDYGNLYYNVLEKGVSY